MCRCVDVICRYVDMIFSYTPWYLQISYLHIYKYQGVKENFNSCNNRCGGMWTTSRVLALNGDTNMKTNKRGKTIKKNPQRVHNKFTTSSQRFHNKFTTISQRFHNDFTTSSQRGHNDFTTISQRFHNDFTTISHNEFTQRVTQINI